MKKTIIIILSAVAFISGFLIFYRSRPSGQNTPSTGTTQQTSNSQGWETKTDDQANVNVIVTPLDLSPQSAEWKFDVGMNTHSVELDQDMTQSVVLIGDDGKEYKPTKWDGPTGGHHKEGVLTFNSITPTPKSVELKITRIADTVRTFTWQLNK
ncbi:MAG: hypothetical protein B7W98_03450 [Parcubacteria group bacterium 20-58-5]|nr:MAG: hypothetical protein B7W98_03450 [Parcubacteria group bacterium 20-58-5]